MMLRIHGGGTSTTTAFPEPLNNNHPTCRYNKSFSYAISVAAFHHCSRVTPLILKRHSFKEPKIKDWKLCARRRMPRPDLGSQTYVLLEPGKKEEFVSQEELRARLKAWLENWPAGPLPPDLAKFDVLDDAVSYLVTSVCELEIDGDVGSIQWYEVRLD